MREDWIETEIISVANLYQPKTISSKMLVENGKYAVYGANGIIGCYHKFNHEEAEFVITCRGATCGNVHITKPYSWINGNAMVVQPFKKQLLSLDYLKYVFTNKVRVQKAISGSAQPQITRTTLSPIRIPLAPLPEQRALVAKIEELLSELDKGEEDLKKAQEQLKIYRQAVLKKAFEGELTKKWRQVKKADLEEWRNCSISAISEVINGDRGKNYPSRAHYIESGIPFISAGNINANNILNEDLNYISREKYDSLRAGKLKIGDIVYCIRGSIGKFAIVDFEEGAIASSLCIIRTKEAVNRNFLCHYLASPLCELEIDRFDNGTAQPNLSAKDFKKFSVPLPNLDEQKQIVQEIESRLSVCDSIEASIRESLNKSKALRQSILKKAFEGTLLSEEEIAACKAAPDYEPASVLLERIKAEKKKN